MKIRQRVVDSVEEDHTHLAAAAEFRVLIKFVNDMVLLKRATGSLEAKLQGNGGGHGKLAGVADWTLRRIKEKRDLIAVPELTWGAQWINNRTFRIVEVYAVATVMYLVAGYVILLGLRMLERRFRVER